MMESVTLMLNTTPMLLLSFASQFFSTVSSFSSFVWKSRFNLFVSFVKSNQNDDWRCLLESLLKVLISTSTAKETTTATTQVTQSTQSPPPTTTTTTTTTDSQGYSSKTTTVSKVMFLFTTV
jgi:hypothetical protein